MIALCRKQSAVALLGRRFSDLAPSGVLRSIDMHDLWHGGEPLPHPIADGLEVVGRDVLLPGLGIVEHLDEGVDGGIVLSLGTTRN